MNHNYIRIYCNEKKVRSTGNEKWYRDDILASLGIGWATSVEQLKKYPKLYEKVFEEYSAYVSNYMMSHPKKTLKSPYLISVEFVKTNKKGEKMSLGYFGLPFYIKANEQEKELRDSEPFRVPFYELSYAYQINTPQWLTGKYFYIKDKIPTNLKRIVDSNLPDLQFTTSGLLTEGYTL